MMGFNQKLPELAAAVAGKIAGLDVSAIDPARFLSVKDKLLRSIKNQSLVQVCTVCPQLFALNCLPSTVCPQLSHLLLVQPYEHTIYESYIVSRSCLWHNREKLVALEPMTQAGCAVYCDLLR